MSWIAISRSLVGKVQALIPKLFENLCLHHRQTYILMLTILSPSGVGSMRFPFEPQIKEVMMAAVLSFSLSRMAWSNQPTSNLRA